MNNILLENIKIALNEKKIDEIQALYLIYTYQKIPMNIDPEDLLILTSLKYIHSGKVGKILLTQDSPIKDVIAGTIKPSYINDISCLLYTSDAADE